MLGAIGLCIGPQRSYITKGSCSCIVDSLALKGLLHDDGAVYVYTVT